MINYTKVYQAIGAKLKQYDPNLTWSRMIDGALFIKLFVSTLLSVPPETPKRDKINWGLLSLLGSIVALTAVFLALLSPYATADYQLPPRDPLQAGVTTSSTIGGQAGVRIHLQGDFAPNWPWDSMHWQEDLWHVLEWQDNQGAWNRVDGWQGHFDAVFQGEANMVGFKEFWADNAHLGTGPFRWRVYKMDTGRLMATSPTFYLPAEQGQLVTVRLSLNPE